jgi:hypothetical protein
MTTLRSFILSAALAVLPGTLANAGSVIISLDSTTLKAAPGSTVIFHGTVTNLESVIVDLNGSGTTLSGQFTTDDGSLFFNNAPFTLNPGETSLPFDIFSVMVNLPYTTPYTSAPFPGVFTILGGLELPGGTTPDTNLGQVTFGVVVTPEPGTAGMLLFGSPLVALALRRIVAGQQC